MEWIAISAGLFTAVLVVIFGVWNRFDISRLSKDISDMKSTLSYVWGVLSVKFPENFRADQWRSSGTIGGKSPLTLKVKGQRLAKEMEADKIVEKYAGRILIPGDADALHIQEVCMAFVFNDFLPNVVDDKERKVIRDAIYQENGNTSDILAIFGILFRDVILGSRGMAVPEYETPPQGRGAPANSR